jgi:hypothetical protein
MDKIEKKDLKKKDLKSSVKALTSAVALAGSLLLSTPAKAEASEKSAELLTLKKRVQVVNEALSQKLGEGGQLSFSYSEGEVTQWGNWANWGNWNNWRNWNNWSNWGNWGNWGNI